MTNSGSFIPDPPPSAQEVNPSFASYLAAHPRLGRALSRIDFAELTATTGGLLTTPAWQASSLRLQVLQHLGVIAAGGTKRVAAAQLRSWLNELGNGVAGRLEDPAEDVFVSRVFGFGKEFLLFNGLSEGSAFLLQRFLDILGEMPTRHPYEGMRQAAHSLLQLSNELVRRSSISAFEVGQTQPIREIPAKLLRDLPELRRRVAFSQEDLRNLDIDLSDLRAFVFDVSQRDLLRDEKLGHTRLERSPLIVQDDSLYFAVPTAVSLAIRRMLIEFCESTGLGRALYTSFSRELAVTFSANPLLGIKTALRFQEIDGVFVANIARYVDKGRLFHVCFIVDDFENYSTTGMNGVSTNAEQFGIAVQRSVARIHEDFSSQEEFREGVTLVVVCAWGRPFLLQFDNLRDARWRVDHIGASDLDVLNWEPHFSSLALWRLLDACDRLRQMNVELLNVNGLLNLYAWSESLDGHLVPHGELSDDYIAETPVLVVVRQNGLLAVRKRSADSWNFHYAQSWDGRTLRVCRLGADSDFEEDKRRPLYVSVDSLRGGPLLGVFEGKSRSWWVTVETPNIPDRNYHYHLWHMCAEWLSRSAPVLEDAGGLPSGPIAWICHFEDAYTQQFDDSIPSREQAKALVDVEVRGYETHVRARAGFLSSFRNPTNIGESLLVEALVSGVLSYSGQEPAPGVLRPLISQIVRDEGARDMHFFVAREFRDFVRDQIPRSPILIERSDDAYSRLGLGWRRRPRAAGARIKGIQACCDYLAEVVDAIWADIRAVLKHRNRRTLLLQLLANHESAAVEGAQWLRTARSLLALHEDKEETEFISAINLASFNAVSASTRILMEMALCESPELGGDEAGELDIARLQSAALEMYSLGGWSEAIRFEGKIAEIRITPLGDIHTHVDFDQKIANRYGEALGIKRFRYGADSYERYFRDVGVQESAESGFPPAFWEAWRDTFKFTIDDLRVFMDGLENEGIRRREFAFLTDISELSRLFAPDKLPSTALRSILDALCLKPRPAWDQTPLGFSARDWYPWRFRRRLSIISRPILQLTETDVDAPLLVTPGILRDGVMKVIDYCFRGGYEAKDFAPGPMRSWIGAAENSRGHEFNASVATRLSTLGWQTIPNIKLTEILNAKLDRDYGDVDVLAWRDNRIVALECKDLELAMTVGEIARQLYEFRGEADARGRPDRLRKHLVRLDVMKARRAAVQLFTHATETARIEAGLVFSDIVPMHFSEVAARYGVRFVTLDELEDL